MSRIVVAIAICCFAVLGFASMAGATPLSPQAPVLVAPDVLFPVDSKSDGKKSGQKHKNRDDDDDDDKPKKSKDKVIPKTCGKKVNCDVGYVKLSKPNAHGACCEVRDAPAKQQEAAKCKFPGQINPPNCDCPPGTTFLGYKGCVPEDSVKKAMWCCRAANGAAGCSPTEANARVNAELNAKGAPVTCALE